MNFRSMCFSTIPPISTRPPSAIPAGTGTGTSSKRTRAALASLKLKDPAGEPIYPLELPADFDFWNILCTQAGHPALDLGVWHLGDVDTKESQMRALDLIHEIFQGLNVTAPLPKAGEPPGRLFRATTRRAFDRPFGIRRVPAAVRPRLHPSAEDMERASLARVNGWAVTAQSSQTEAARALAGYLAFQPVHAGWSSVRKPAEDNSPAAICYEALEQALVPRIEPKSERMAQFLDQQIDLLARNAQQNTDELYDRIQTEFQSDTGAPPRPPDKAKPEGGSPAPAAGL